MRPSRLALLVCAAWAAAGEPPVRLPQASMGKNATADGAAIVRLSAEGQILVERDGSESAVSLEQLGEWLRARRDRFEEKRPAKDGPSELPVVLLADEQAPWGHALWLIGACARENLYRVEFGVKGASGEEGRLAAHLPKDTKDKSDGSKRTAPVSIEIYAKSEETTVWGPTQTGIRRPKEIGYRVGETLVPGIDGVRRYLQDAYEPGVRGEIVAAANIPLRTVVQLLDEYCKAGLTEVQFKPVKSPTAAERRMLRLPYPPPAS